jgi:hypothetical protein
MNKTLALAILGMMIVSGIASAYGNNDKVDFYDEWGTKTGSASKGYNGTVEYYDEWGSKTGSARKGYNGTVDYYDEWGTKTGSSKQR